MRCTAVLKHKQKGFQEAAEMPSNSETGPPRRCGSHAPPRPQARVGTLSLDHIIYIYIYIYIRHSLRLGRTRASGDAALNMHAVRLDIICIYIYIIFPCACLFEHGRQQVDSCCRRRYCAHITVGSQWSIETRSSTEIVGKYSNLIRNCRTTLSAARGGSTSSRRGSS